MVESQRILWHSQALRLRRIVLQAEACGVDVYMKKPVAMKQVKEMLDSMGLVKEK